MKHWVMVCLIVMVVVLGLSIYPIYAIIVWNSSKSPDDFSKFPKSGVWVCKNNDFVMTINLDTYEQDGLYHNAINAEITISFDGNTYNLDCYQSAGHGTILAPVAPSRIIYFKTSNELTEEDYNRNNIHFTVSRYKFNENDFYFLNISLGSSNKVSFLKDNMTLHFIKK